ncbi:MAG: hypothetical protein F4X60_14885 [Gemmatimonadetes bacterium]|nr:hypothetical protein [Gemmatimonadota bacterium]MYB99819.1 hypothetical protein [Gemmatimonadota bacterium]
MTHQRSVFVGTGTLMAILCASACGEPGTEPPDPPDPPAAPDDRGALVKLYDATRGVTWVNNDGWNTDAPLGEWYGVETDVAGRVVSLDLSGVWDEESYRWKRHGLVGRIPLELGGLTQLRSLVLSANELRGSIPFELGNLSRLTRLDLGNNRLTDGIPSTLGNLSQLRELDLRDNALFGLIPSELGKLIQLERLLLDGNELSGRIPRELGDPSGLSVLSLSHNLLQGAIPWQLANLTRLTSLSLAHNRLTDIIPSAFGSLANLTTLLLHENNLRGYIPPALGNLTLLTELSLHGNALDSHLPPELGKLIHLERLSLHGNALTGEIPPELGNLAAVRELSLSDNRLSGTIPPTLGQLSSASYLALDRNDLTGQIPAELSILHAIERLHLEFNDLTGSIPAEFGNLATLRELGLTGNHFMAGPIPTGITALPRLDALMAGGTGLCVPADPVVLAWLERVHKRRIVSCNRDEPPQAYLIQTVQSREFPVPLVADEEALLRVFVTAERPTTATIPAVRARFYRDDVETHVEEIPGKPTEIPTEVIENLLSKSANARIPGHVVQPGLEMVIEIDPERTLDPELGVATRIPESGRLPVEVHAMPVLDLTLVPFVWAEDPDHSIGEVVRGIAADPEDHDLLRQTRTLLPVGDLDVTSHLTVTSNSNHSVALLRETTAIRAMEGGTGHYLGLMSPPVSGPTGLAHFPGRSSFGLPYATLIAHLLGHNFFLGDAPCGDVARPDLSYPDPLGAIGVWAYDSRGNGRLIPPTWLDIMSYCDPAWISDYHFTNALRFRLSEADSVGLPMIAESTRALLLWGGLEANGTPFLEPAFVLDAPAALPRSAGEYRITGQTEDGALLFSLTFGMPEVADGDGSSGFAFVLPVGDAWEGTLSVITLTGPGGSVVLDGWSDLSMAVVREPRTGEVRAILRDLPATVLSQADAAAVVSPDPGLEVLFSRGIPAGHAWRR